MSSSTSHGFKLDFIGWDVKSSRAKLLHWAESFFGDCVWVNDQQLLGWSSENHTPAGLRQLVHNNLKNWKCAKLVRHNRGWVSPLTVNEFRALVGRVPKPVHTANVCVVTELLAGILDNVSNIGAKRTPARKRIREEELECYTKCFKSLRANAVGITKRAAEAVQHKISHLRAHLELLSQVRASHPDVMFYLADDWEKRTLQSATETYTRKMATKGKKGATFYREYEEKRETAILQELEKSLEDLVGEK